jgi:hypothetical protein
MTTAISLTKDPSGAPAVDLTKLRDAHPDLVKRAEKAGISLSKRGLDGVRAQAVVILDHSGSMSRDYKDGTVQTLVERALGFALQIDVDGVVPVIPFDSRVRETVEVGVHNYRGVVDREIWDRRGMGSTNLAAALGTLKTMAARSDAPLFAIVICDGSPDSKAATTRVVCELADYPVFLKFLAIKPVDYLQDLDDLPASKRRLDNVDAKFIADSAGMTDLAFADAMVDEWDTWIAAATSAGVLN